MKGKRREGPPPLFGGSTGERYHVTPPGGWAESSLVTARNLVDTSVLSEPLRKTPDEVAVSKLREHGAELAPATVVWHEETGSEWSRGAGSRPRSRSTKGASG